MAGTLELLAKGRIPASFWDWGYGRLFSFRKNEDEVDPEPAADGELPLLAPSPSCPLSRPALLPCGRFCVSR